MGLRNGGVQANIAKHWRIKSVSQASTAHAKLSWDNRAPAVGTTASRKPLRSIHIRYFLKPQQSISHLLLLTGLQNTIRIGLRLTLDLRNPMR